MERSMALETLNKNNFMKWQEIQNSVYYKDGSLRDVYIHETTFGDWIKWINYVNENYKIKFYNRLNEITLDKIDFNEVVKYWKKENQEGISASINVNGINLMCYFNLESEIELDFTPKEIIDIEAHNALINFFKACSTILHKPVVVTAEMTETEVLLKVINEDVYFY
jgi:hypothetical protein